jgi:hypothetical protein
VKGPKLAKERRAEVALRDHGDGSAPGRSERLARLLDGDQHDDHLGSARGQPARGLDAVHSGHAHVQKHQVGAQPLDDGKASPASSNPGEASITASAARLKTAWSSTVTTRTAITQR